MAKPKRAQPKRNGQQGRRAVAADPAAGAAARKGKAAKDGAKAAGAGAAADADPQSPADVAPPMGLQNLGNTCFFNSTLQVLAAAPAVQQYFSGDRQLGLTAPLGSAMRELVQTAAGSSAMAAAATAAPACAKRGGLAAAKRASANVYSPHRLLAAVRKIAPQFKGGGQQDSHELLRCLLAGLQAEEDKALKLSAKDARGDATSGADAAAAAGQPAAAGEGQPTVDSTPEATQPPASMIEQLFGGRLASTVVCGSCSHSSTQSERFMDLSLPIASVPAASAKPAGDQGPGSGPVAAPAPRAAKPLSSKQRKAALKQERKTAKLARSRAARSGSGELAAGAAPTAKGRRMLRVPLTPADVIRHSPPGRGAIPPRPAIRSGSMSSLASSDASFSAAAQQSLNPSAGVLTGSRLGSVSSFDGRGSFGGGDSGGGGDGDGAGGDGGAGTAAQPHPMRLTLELMNSLSPPLGASPDDFEDDPFLRAMSRASTPPTSVISDADSTAAARYSSGPNSVPPSPHGSDCDGDGRSPTSGPPSTGRTASSSGAAAPVPIPAAGPAAWRTPAAAAQAAHPGGSPASPAAGAAAELRLRGGGGGGPPELSEAAAVVGSPVSASTDAGAAAGSTHKPSADGSDASGNRPKLLGGAEPETAAVGGAEMPVNGESEAALAAAAQAARRAAAEAEEAAVAIAAEATARSEAPAVAQPQPPPDQGRKAAAMQRQNSFLDDSIQVAGTAATAEAAGFSSARPADSSAAADGAAADGTAAGSSVAASQSSAFAVAAHQPAPAERPDAAAVADSGSDGEAMGALGDLFDESGVQGAVQGAAVDIVLSDDDFDHQDRTGPAANSGDTSLRDCLAAFFAPEDITYTCPAEAAAAGKAAAAAAAAAAAGDPKFPAAATAAAAGSAGTGGAPQLALLGTAPSASSAASDASAARKVSWSDSPHVVVMIPGSEEQRGTDLRAACKGHEPFSRPMSYNGANLLVTAQMDQFRNDTLALQIHPHDMELSTISLLDRTLDLATVHIDRIQGFDDREEQARIQEGAQILMDCVADIVDNHGLGPLRLMCETMQLERLSEEDADAAGVGAWQLPPVQYRVTGVMPDGVGKDGWKSWQYPSAAHPRRSSGSYGAMAMRSTSLDTASSGSLDFVLSSSSSSGGSGGGTGGQAAHEMSLPPALEHAAGLAHRTASGSRSRGERSGGDSSADDGDGDGGGGGGGVGGDSSHPVVVVDKRLYRSAPELADIDASAGGDPQQQPCDSSDKSAAPAAVSPPIGEAAASAVAAVDLEEAAEAGDAATAPAGWTDSKPPTGIARNRSPEGEDVTAGNVRSKSPKGGDEGAGVPPGPAVKSYAVQHPPQLLTLHLKRFEQDKRGQFRKVSRRVCFDFRLDVSQWLADSGSRKQQPLARYQLVGVVEHSGTMRSGHYVAYVQRGAAAQRLAAPAAASAAGTVQPLPSAAALAVAAASVLAQPTPDAASDAAVPGTADADAGPCSEADGLTLPPAAATATEQPAARPALADGKSAEQPSTNGGGGGGSGSAEVQPEQLAWFRVSDQHVKRVSWAQVAAAEAYLLLYARC